MASPVADDTEPSEAARLAPTPSSPTEMADPDGFLYSEEEDVNPTADANPIEEDINPTDTEVHDWPDSRSMALEVGDALSPPKKRPRLSSPLSLDDEQTRIIILIIALAAQIITLACESSEYSSYSSYSSHDSQLDHMAQLMILNNNAVAATLLEAERRGVLVEPERRTDPERERGVKRPPKPHQQGRPTHGRAAVESELRRVYDMNAELLEFTKEKAKEEAADRKRCTEAIIESSTALTQLVSLICQPAQEKNTQ